MSGLSNTAPNVVKEALTTGGEGGHYLHESETFRSGYSVYKT